MAVAKHIYRQTKCSLVAVQNSTGEIFTIGQKGTYNETGEPIYIKEIREPITKGVTEYRIRIADKDNKLFLTLDIEYATQFLTFK